MNIKKKYDLVIARYNEDISWLNQLNFDDINLIVYNKGEHNINFPFKILKNILRAGDAHTYISYIVENYYNFPEFIIFLQGNPFDHCSSVLEKIKNHKEEQIVYLTDHYLTCENLNGWYEFDPKFSSPLYPVHRLIDTARELLGSEVPFNIEFGAGQQFIMNKKFILNRSLDFYEKILSRFQYDYNLPWNIERLWKYILKA